jgi:FMN-dependent NADH-azoreductase
MRVLHIVATPREHKSNTLRIADTFLESLSATCPQMTVDVVDLYHQDLPAVAGTNIDVKYTLMVGQPIDKSHLESWQQIERLIEHFLRADLYVISAPMWNLSIPYALKYYIDCLVQPGYVFRYDETGNPVPLVLGKRMICVTSRGGDYSAQSPLHAFDFQEPYLRAIFGFIGITDMHFINAQPMDHSAALQEAAVAASMTHARQLVADGDWNAVGATAIGGH